MSETTISKEVDITVAVETVACECGTSPNLRINSSMSVDEEKTDLEKLDIACDKDLAAGCNKEEVEMLRQAALIVLRILEGQS